MVSPHSGMSEFKNTSISNLVSKLEYETSRASAIQTAYDDLKGQISATITPLTVRIQELESELKK
ncbi:MAG: hypothetical protein O3C54_07290, partial [Proteobacteria bacterium]|nr:hypothetical protein [Pseudomonadota bacterium]